MYAAWKSNTTILEVINPEVAAADRASALVMAAMVKMAANTAKDAAMAAATGGTSVAAKGAASAAGAAAKSAGSAAKSAGSAAKSAGNAFTGGSGGPGNVAKLGQSLGGSDKKENEEKKQE